MSKKVVHTLAWLSDSHAGVRNDAHVFLDYQEVFYRDVFFPELEKRGIKHILHGGDYFDRRKYLNYQTLARNKEMFVGAMSDGMKMDLIVGNHDVALKHSNEINSPAMLLQSDKIAVHYQAPVEVTLGNTKCIYVPWINNSNYHATMEALEKTDARVCFGHFEFAGFEMYRGIKSEDGMKTDSVFAKFDAVYTGHFHTRSSKGNIHYLGAPMEFTWADANDPRGFSIFTFYEDGSHEVEFVQNPHKMFYVLEYDDSEEVPSVADIKDDIKDRFVKLIVRSKKDLYAYDLYVSSLLKLNPYDLKIADMVEFEDEEELDSKVEMKDTLSILCDHADRIKGLPKARITEIKKLIRELHAESLQTTDL